MVLVLGETMTTPNLTVYHMEGSRSLRALWILEELELPYSVKSVRFDLGNAGGEEYRRIHPLNKVPALIDGDVTMFESLAILQYIMDKYGDGDLRPNISDADYSAYLQWFHFGEATLTPLIVTLMQQRRFFDEENRDEYIENMAEKELVKQLKFLSDQLGTHEYVLERGFTAADVSIGYCLLLAKFAGAKNVLPEIVQQYWRRLSERPAWARASK